MLRPARAALALAALLAACSVTHSRLGAPLPADPGASITEGRTTRAEILARFGPPAMIARHAQGEVFRYEYLEKSSRTLDLADPIVTGLGLFKYGASEEQSQQLVVLFDAQGIVSGFGYRDSARPEPLETLASPAASATPR